MKSYRRFIEQRAPAALARSQMFDTPARARRAAEEESGGSGCGGWLIGLLILLGIGAVVAALLIPAFAGRASDQARSEMARAQAAQLGQAVEQYRMIMTAEGRDEVLPSSLDELAWGPDDWEGEWMPLLPPGQPVLDPWGNEWVYQVTDNDAGFVLVSYGRDGMPGGSGPDADITYP